jgi:uncharacterized protein GlcG (DUF336 family)
MRHVMTSCLFSAALLLGSAAHAQQPAAPPSYGEPITLEMAKAVADAAEAEAKKNNWAMAIAIVTPSGDLAYFRRMDNTQYASTTIALHKAKAAATFKRATKTFEDRVASGGIGLTALTLDGMIASEGGLPIMVGGKVVGAIGVSGATGQQDGQTAMAGAGATMAQASAAK